jgi:hypothetical protein
MCAAPGEERTGRDISFLLIDGLWCVCNHLDYVLLLLTSHEMLQTERVLQGSKSVEEVDVNAQVQGVTLSVCTRLPS